MPLPSLPSVSSLLARSAGFLVLLLVLAAGPALVANEVSSSIITNGATEGEPFFNQDVSNAVIRIQRTAPLYQLTIGINVSGAAVPALSASATAGADYILVQVALNGTESTVELTPITTGTLAGSFSGSLLVRANDSGMNLELRPINDGLIEGGESAIIRVMRDEVTSPDDNNDGIFDNDYVVSDTSAREIVITDADVQVSLAAVDPRADEYIASTGVVAGQPFMPSLGAFRYTLTANPTAVRATVSPQQYRISMVRAGDARNSFEESNDGLSTNVDYDLVRSAANGNSAGAGVDLVAGFELVSAGGVNQYKRTGIEPVGATDIELEGSLPPNTPPPGFFEGQIFSPWVNQQVNRFDVVAFQNHPHFYFVSNVVDARYLGAGMATALIRPGFITIAPALLTARLNTGDEVYKLGTALSTSLTDRRVEFQQAAPGATGATQAELSGFLRVIPYPDEIPEGAEEVELSLIASSDYILRTPQRDRVLIADDDSIANIVRVTDAIEGSTQGVFRFTLTKPLPKPVSLRYSIGGTATNGIDYNTLSGAITIAAGQQSINFQVTALADALVETDNLILTLSESPDYILAGTGSGSSNPTATIQIFDLAAVNAVPNVSVNVVANALEPDVVGAFQLTLSAPRASDTVVAIQIGGTASRNVDYVSVASLVIIPANTLTALVAIQPIDDTRKEGNETITLLVKPGDGYATSSTNGYTTMTLIDNDSGSGGVDTPGQPVQQNNGGGCGLGSSTGLLLVGFALILVLRVRTRRR